MADETPPRSSSGRKIPVPMPVLIGIGVAILAGIYLMRRNATKAATTQPATAAQPPVILAGNGGGGMSSGLLYTLLQNLQSSPQPAPSPSPAPTPAPSPSPAGPGGPAWLQGLVGTPLSQALQTLQNNGVVVNTVQNMQGQNINPAGVMNSQVGQVTYFGPGKAGSNFANSVTLAVR